MNDGVELRGAAAELFRSWDAELLIVGAAGTGKAQPMDATVWTPSGPTRMGDVEVGDEILTPAGVDRVRSIHPQGVKDVYEVTFSTGAKARCTDDHLWQVHWRLGAKNGRMRMKARVMRLSAIAMDYLHTSQNQPKYCVKPCQPAHLTTRPVEIDPYVLGVLLGDGCIRRGNLSFTSADQFVVDEVQRLLPDDHVLRFTEPMCYRICAEGWSPRHRARSGYRIQKRYGRFYLTVREGEGSVAVGSFATEQKAKKAGEVLAEPQVARSGIWGSLRMLDLEGRHSWDKFVPDCYLYNDEHTRKSMLQGLMDTDGTVNRKAGSAEFTSVSRALAENVQYLVESLGGMATIRTRVPTYRGLDGEMQDGRIAYTLFIRHNDPASLFRLPRKRALCRQRTKRQALWRIQKIEFVGREQCQCISISSGDLLGGGLYLTDHMIPTHNSRAVCERLHFFAETYPKCRLLMARKTRARMGQSVLVTFEDHVVPEGHPCLTNVSRAYRESYKYPNGSEIVVGGMDDPTRVMSTDYDVVVAFEATEFTLDDWERMTTRLRNHRIPHPLKKGKFMEQAIADCNPGAEFHWLNQRAKAGVMKRLMSRHEDNPSVTEEYLDKLRVLTGPRRARLYEGLWVSMTGQIWENFRASEHVVKAECKRIDGRWRIVDEDEVVLAYVSHFMAGVDWGFTAPGSLLVAAIDVDGGVWIVHEVYMTGKDINWWAGQAERLRKKYDIQWFVCDPSRPENIAVFNKRMGRAGGFHIASEVDIAGGANNAIQAGLSVVRERWAADTLHVLADALEMRDPELDEDSKPCGLVEEIPSYVYAESKDGRPIEEGPDPGCDDHSADVIRYLCLYLDANDWADTDAPKDGSYPPGSYGAVMGHDEVFAENLDWINEWA